MNRNTNGKRQVRDAAKPQSALEQRIENLRMSESERQVAREWLRDGELLGDFIRRSEESIESAAELVSSHFLHRAR